MNYRALAKSILNDIGGFENIVSFTHCLTRLRFNLKDEDRVDAARLKETRGVMGVIISGGQYQVVVGNNVKQIYNELSSITEIPETISPADASRSFDIREVLYIIKGVFLPLLPIVAGEALLGGTIFLLMRFGIADNNSNLILWLSAIFKSVFYFLPFLISFTVAKTFTVNPIVIMTAVGIISYSEVHSLVFSKIALRMDLYNLIYIGIGVIIISALVSILKSDKLNMRRRENDADENKVMLLCAPIKGRVIGLQESGDIAFSEGEFGEGCAIVPETNLVVAPECGAVESISEKQHAITLVTQGGVEVLVHIGVYTAGIEGEFFETFVKVGDAVRCGDPLIEFDKNAIKMAGYDLTVFMTIMNSESYASVEVITDNATEQRGLIEIVKAEIEKCR